LADDALAGARQMQGVGAAIGGGAARDQPFLLEAVDDAGQGRAIDAERVADADLIDAGLNLDDVEDAVLQAGQAEARGFLVEDRGGDAMKLGREEAWGGV